MINSTILKDVTVILPLYKTPFEKISLLKNYKSINTIVLDQCGDINSKKKREDMHCDTEVDMSYGKLKCTSTMNLPGMSPFKIHDYPCHTCMDVNGKRANHKSVSGRDTCDVQFDLFDMSKCENIGGHRYCTVIVMRQSRFVFIFLHKTKDEIQSVWTKCINTQGDTN